MHLIQHGLAAQDSHIAPLEEEVAEGEVEEEAVEDHLELQAEGIQTIEAMAQS